MRTNLAGNHFTRKFFLKGLGIFLTLSLSLSIISSVSAQDQTAETGFFSAYEVAPGEVIQVPVMVRNVEDLYGLDIQIEFDPEVLQVADADPSSTGIQVALGDFLDPGLLLFNTADNETGLIRFVMTQYNPSEPKSGEGVVLLINFIGLNEGSSSLGISKVQLVSSQATPISSIGVESVVDVKVGARPQSSTYVPVEPTGLIILYTPTPSATTKPAPTATQLITPIPATPQQDKNETPPLSPNNLEEGTNKTSTANYWLLDNWWILIPLFVAVAVAGAYYFKKRSQNKRGK